MNPDLVITFLAIITFAFLTACQPNPNSSGGLSQSFSAEMPVAGSIVFSSR